MKRTIISILSLCATIALYGQNYQILDVAKADRNKEAGLEGPYRFDAPALTASPKGYTPFYVGHYGRHGSRYPWSDSVYKSVKSTLDAAAKADALTGYGKDFYNRFNEFYLEPYLNTGDLSALGFEQQKKIAAIMVEEFPEVFKNGGKVTAKATTSQRAIMSMTGFCIGLQKSAPKVNIFEDALHTSLVVTNPSGAPGELRERYEGRVNPPSGETLEQFKARKIDSDGVLDKLFKDRDFLENLGGKDTFITNLFGVWANYHNITDNYIFEDLFTPEQVLGFWEIENYGAYSSQTFNRFQCIPLIRDIIALADDAIANGNYVGNFRFGHDTVVNPLITTLDLNGYGHVADTYENIKYYFQNFNCSMAANIQFVLYRPKKAGDILFKVLLNGAEATLPQLTAVEGPYYKWNDFKEWAEILYSEHPRIN